MKIHNFSHPSERRAAPLTLLKGCRDSKPQLSYGTLGEVLAAIPDPKNKALIDFTNALQTARNQSDNLAAYKELKETQSPAFILGKYQGTKDADCLEYLPCLAFDVDGCELQAVALQIIRDLSALPYIYAAFLSPSGRGVRFLVWANSTIQTHKDQYLSILGSVSAAIDLPSAGQLRRKHKGIGAKELAALLRKTPHLDVSTNNPARLWFYASTAHTSDGFYLNEASQVYYIKDQSKDHTPPALAAVATVPDLDKIKVVRDKVARQNIAPGRNNYVFALACECARHGVPLGLALAECQQYEETGFSFDEIKKSVESAYRSKTVEFTDEQIKKYIGMTNGNGKPATEPKPKKAQAAAAPNKAETLEPGKPNEQPESGQDYEERPKFIKIRELLGRRYNFRMNIISNEIEVNPKGSNEWQELNENNLICEVLEAGFNGVEAPLMALLRSDFVPKHDPFQAYFENLPEWREGVDPDYIEQLANFVLAKDQFWFNTQFKKMLVRVVACALGHIPFNKHCLVLKSEQNDGKSSFLRFLCPPALQNYMTDHIDIDNKDGRIALCQNLFINLDELSQFSKADVKRTKALFTIDKVKERLPYDRKPSNHRRRASFLASTNEDEFLVDETGNVRWLVFEIEGIRHDNGGAKGYNAQVNIDLVYAQAFALLKGGFPVHLSREEIDKSELNNRRFQVANTEQELIEECFAPAQPGDDGAEFLTATDIMLALTKAYPELRIYDNRIGRALKFLGFERQQRFFKDTGFQKKGYWLKRLQKAG